MQKKPDILTTSDAGKEIEYGCPRSLNVFFKCVEGDPTNPIKCETDNAQDFDIADEIDMMIDVVCRSTNHTKLTVIYFAVWEYLESFGIELPPKRPTNSDPSP